MENEPLWQSQEEGILPSTTRLAVCTVVARNHAASAATLCASVYKAHPQAACFVLCIDGMAPALEGPWEVLSLADIGLSSIEQTCFKYSLYELQGSLKPLLLQYVLSTRLYEKAIYCDSDVWVTGSLSGILEKLDTFDAVLTPHIERAYPEGDDPHYVAYLDALLRDGLYNTGFFAARNTPGSLAILEWWRACLVDNSTSDYRRPFFVDQKIMDLAPLLFEGICIEKDTGYNVAYWNLHSRRISFTADGWRCNQSALQFFHFSNFDVATGSFRPGVRRSGNGEREQSLIRLCSLYRNEVLANGYEACIDMPYGYGRFRNGDTVEYSTRQAYRLSASLRNEFPSPFASPQLVGAARRYHSGEILRAGCHEVRCTCERKQVPGSLVSYWRSLLWTRLIESCLESSLVL